MTMDEWIKAIQKKINEGAWVKVLLHEDSYTEIQYVGGVCYHIMRNYIVYTSAFPDGFQDWHHCLCSNFKRIDNYSIKFKDQYGREVTVMSFEPFEKEAIKIFKKWKEQLNTYPEIQERFNELAEEFREDPSRYLGGYWYE